MKNDIKKSNIFVVCLNLISVDEKSSTFEYTISDLISALCTAANSNIQGRSPNVVKVIFHLIRNCSVSKFFPLREVPTLKRDAIEENQFLI